MPNGETSLVTWLIGTGAFIALGKLLTSSEPLTFRLVIGRVILGSAVSLIAGVTMLHFEDVHYLALIGIASALGILGHSVVESLLKRYVQTKVKKEG